MTEDQPACPEDAGAPQPGPPQPPVGPPPPPGWPPTPQRDDPTPSLPPPPPALPPQAGPPPPPGWQSPAPYSPDPAPYGAPAGYAPPELDRYRGSSVFGWTILTFVLLVPLVAVVALAAAQAGGGGFVLGLCTLLVPLAPITWAVRRMRRAPSKDAATPWLGVLMGSALFLLLFSGPCVVLLASIG